MLKRDHIIVIIKIISSMKEEILWTPSPGESAGLETSPRSSQQSSESLCPGKSGHSALETSFSAFSTLGMNFPKRPQKALKENCLPAFSLPGQKSVFPHADLCSLSFSKWTTVKERLWLHRHLAGSVPVFQPSFQDFFFLSAVDKDKQSSPTGDVAEIQQIYCSQP